MKKVIFQVAVLMMTAGYAFTAVAKDTPTKATSRFEVVTTQKGSVYKLNYASESEGSVRVNIYGPQGGLLYTDNVEKVKAFNKFYDFSGLTQGTYTIEVVGTDGKIQKSIQYVGANSGLKVDVKNLDAKKFDLKVQREKMAPVVVSVYNDSNELIYQDNIDVDHNFTRVYDFSKAFSNAAAVEVTSEGTTVRKEIL